MYDNYNYPPGADTPDAPWNEPIIPERDFEVDVEFVMRKNAVDVTTDKYVPEFDDEDGHTYANTEDTDWEQVYGDSGHYTILEMLDELKQYVEEDLKTCSPNTCKGASLKRLLADCQSWEVYEKSFSES